MRIVSTYSSWTRDRLTPGIRDRIRDAGEGDVRFYPAMGKPRGWIGCAITAPDGSGSAVAATPGEAFDKAVIELSVQIVSVLR